MKKKVEYKTLAPEEALYDAGFEDKSMFNMGISTLMRIHALLLDCNTFSRMGELKKWYSTLMALYKEIYPLMKKGKLAENNEVLQMNVILTDLRPIWHEFVTKTDKGIPTYGMGDQVINLLNKFEMELRVILHRRDMYSPKRDIGGFW